MSEGFSSETRGEVDGTAPVVSANALLVAVIVIGVLYFGREVFIPIALAILLSFVLAIPVRLLQGWGLGRTLPVAVVVLVAFTAILTLAGLVTTQLTQLAGDLPRYQSTIRDKVTSLREATSGHGPLERVGEMLQELSDEFSSKKKPVETAREGDAAAPPPVRVEIVGTESTPLETIRALVSPLLHPLATTGLVAIFVVFILMQRGDLRNRLIRLAGSHDLQRTTAAMNDAATRLSRFFLFQVLLNSTFGVVVGLGLWAIGVPSPILWGILAAISRFIPYVGVVIAAGGPLILSAAVDPNWGMLVQTAILFAIVEVTVGQVVEPLLYGHSTGLSPIAVILSVTFWTWLWGGVGLIVATPLTVCLVVLGRHVDQLRFLDVMFGDRPPLTAAEIFYQRMLAGDAGEGLEQAEVFLKDHSLATYYDEVAVKGLALAQADASRGVLDPPHLLRVEDTISTVIEELSDYDDATPRSETVKPDPKRADGDADLDQSLEASDERVDALPILGPDDLRAEWRGDASVLCVAGRNRLDRAGAQMLAQLLGKHGLRAEVSGPEGVPSGPPVAFDGGDVRIVCLSFLDTSTPVHVRYAVRRLRRRFPGAKVIVGSWGLDAGDSSALCEAARSDECTSRLGQALAICLEAARREPADHGLIGRNDHARSASAA